MESAYKRAGAFIHRNARPVDLVRWRHHFENGSKEAVVKALSCYQNEDGGFGHALEPDSWNPNSTPLQTWAATEILREIHFTEHSSPMIKGMLCYLESGQDFDDGFWHNTVKSNNDYPHAPWWHIGSDSTCHHDYNPTVCLAGFIIRYSEQSSGLHRLGCRIAQEAYKKLMSATNQNDMHIILCYIRLMEYLEEAGARDIIDLVSLKSKLAKLVKENITQNTAEWETSYVCKPSHFLHSKDSVFYADNREIAEYECEFIIKTQLEDGSWNIPWSWKDYSDAWSISRNWWKSNGIIINMRYLSGLGKCSF